MKNVLLISATSGTNLDLAQSIERVLKNYPLKSKIICLEDFNLPLYNGKKISNSNKKNIINLTDLIKGAQGIVICAPEYNGSIPPILTNSIAWISVTTNDWREGFNNKISLIATSSGGDGAKLIGSLKTQLEHLGSIVLPRSISVSNKNKFNEESCNKILTLFLKHI